jgi:hypothetical protein
MPDQHRANVEMAAHYESGIEESRLSIWGQLEFIRTMEILRRYLPAPPATIADVGGGPGAYAWPLAIDGYAVHLLDSDWFTTAYFHHPSELENEIGQGGFDIDALLAVEGPAGWLGNLEWWLAEDPRRDALLTAIRRVESDHSLLGASPHLLTVAHKEA